MATIKSTLSLPLDDTGDGKVVSRYFDGLESAIPQTTVNSTYQADDAIHTIAADVSIVSGNWTITVNLYSGESFTTASIAFGANAATIEGAIDAAATAASVAGWTNGDISVSGGSIDTADVVLTYDGASVTNLNHPVCSVADVDLAGGTVSVVTQTAYGHPALSTLQLIGTQGFLNVPSVYDPTTWTWNTLVPKPEKSVWEYVARAVATELQQPAAYTAIMTLGGFVKPAQPRSSIVS